ncbi:proteasome-activating nucleotidase [Candidatus Woesearchaeota archaeon]|jgi:proteasome regulatory subunit|nr:proteasome-activating nucleotidase [Candidatus Woesearchaeota archaeon]MBT5396734.1 proteasome-activating nucleotidase [Candidatus Woesearchaeota archaeon]MBT5924598.1 proteasome-activating nucleotidase [Candidatus Woesearchaeota archaeon]MBT6367479.1 proteasome-activating nucleotidase [Candidatus Woesearchaeota archaeon]MBT7762978.1 proteasome-activating nucleotidase [Candidatus Woesearchaeota archaeon]
MTKNESKKDVFYSETFEQENTEVNDKSLQSSITKLEEENNTLSQSLNRLEEESNVLRAMFNNVNDELTTLKKPSLLVADIVNVIDEKNAIIKLPNGNKFYCHMSQEAENLVGGDSVLVDQKSLNILKKIDLGNNFEVEKFVIMEKPKESWKEIGGLKMEIQEVKEVIELPLKKPELFEKVGIKPPKGVLLYGPPGTGKTLLAKAVAHSTNATFIEVVGSELVQKFIGEGAKLVKDIFALARQKAPSIVFIDEIDALASVRMENGTSGEREVNRTFMQLLSELDGFKHLGDVKIIGATNRIDILDRAIIRPGRLDRLIEVGLPDEDGRLEIMKVHIKSMNLDKVNVKELVKEMENFSGAEIQAVCTEAGYFAIRESRDHVNQDDFMFAIDKVRFDEEDEGIELFG